MRAAARFLAKHSLLFALAACTAARESDGAHSTSRAAADSAFEIGLIADCQYADADAAGERQYRLAPKKLADCVDDFDTRELVFVVHLGDFIDRDWRSFDVVEPILDRARAPHHHVLGNHDFSVEDARKELVPARMGVPTRWRSFVERGWRFVILDGNDVSLLAHPRGSPRDVASRAWHAARAAGRPEWGGALGAEQLAWLERELASADAAHERVLLFCHYPLRPANGNELWNADEVLDLLAAHPSVAAWINGHEHSGNYAFERGIHCVTLHGMLDHFDNAYAVLGISREQLELDGSGRQPDLSLPLAEP
ncbi:MAG: metallophosphoesterase [Planctomycetes bacterium]|nr:metallophosphoesterase [Planctomycetota bacterium]